jgi:1-acyl-sn-glycerol-3-phosphate acyltransferase
VRIISKAFLVIWRIWFYFLTSISVILLSPIWLFFIFIPNGYRFIFWIARNIWAPFVLYGCGFYVLKINNLKKFSGNYILVANHTSYIDVMVMFRMSSVPFVFVGKKELIKIPIFGFLYKRAVIMVDRSSSKSRFGVYERADEVIEKGYNLCIFPEKNYLDETMLLNSFKQGAFKIALKYKMPIVPLVFLDCKRKFPWYTTHGYPGSLRVKILDPVLLNKKKSTIDLLKKKVYKMIKRELELDPKKASLNAIIIWKKIKKII